MLFMKYFVWKKGIIYGVLYSILFYIGFVALLVYLSLYGNKQSVITIVLYILDIAYGIAITFLMIRLFSTWGAKVVFTERAIISKFITNKRVLLISEIKEYHIFTHYNKGTFIYISGLKLSESEKATSDAIWKLYRKEQKMIILEYNNEVIDFLNKSVEFLKR